MREAAKGYGAKEDVGWTVRNEGESAESLLHPRCSCAFSQRR